MPYPLFLRHQGEVTYVGSEVSSVSKVLWRVVKNFCYRPYNLGQYYSMLSRCFTLVESMVKKERVNLIKLCYFDMQSWIFASEKSDKVGGSQGCLNSVKV